MTKLTYEERKELPKSEFVFPKTRRYPIEDAAHARDALALYGLGYTTRKMSGLLGQGWDTCKNWS